LLDKIGEIIMNQERHINQAEKANPEGDASQLSPEVLDKIKHPPRIDDVLRELPPEELMGNQAVVPQTIDQPSDLRDDLKAD
jgi:hypothetical protein